MYMCMCMGMFMYMYMYMYMCLCLCLCTHARVPAGWARDARWAEGRAATHQIA